MQCHPHLNPDPAALGFAVGAKLRQTSDRDTALLMVRTDRIDSLALATTVAALSSAVSGLEHALAASQAEELCMKSAQARAITGLQDVIQDMRDDFEGIRRSSASTAGPIPRTPEASGQDPPFPFRGHLHSRGNE